ncbi:MAG: hypothetical protein ACR2RE_30245, partial [Geminicoccaceae bacterium]
VHGGRETVIGCSRADLPVVRQVETVGEAPPFPEIRMLGIVAGSRESRQADLAVVARVVLR